MQRNDRPTDKQLRYLRDLAVKTGQTFAFPKTKREASNEIDRLKRVKASPTARADRRREAREVMDAIRTEIRDGAAVQPHEAAGYGSTARRA